MPIYTINRLHIATNASLVYTMITGAVLMTMAPAFGLMADRFSSIRMMSIAMVVITLSTYPMFATLVVHPIS